MIRKLVPPTAAAALVAAAAALSSSGAQARTPRPLISVSATPAHLTLLGRTSHRLVVHNNGSHRVSVVATRASFAFDLYGNAQISPGALLRRSARAWLSVRPSQLVLRPHEERVLRIAARQPRGATAGDHPALVLLSARGLGHAPVSIRTRLGVLVFVRVPGRVVRRMAIGRVLVLRSAPRRGIAVTAINRGNLVERLLAGQVTVALWRGARLVTALRGRARDLLPRTRGLVLVPVRRSLHGAFTADVRIAAQPGRATRPKSPPLRGARRAFALRL